MKTFNDEIKNPGGVEELNDDVLDGVAGGLVQLINPSSTPCYKFHDKTIKCQYCGDNNGKYKNSRMICLSCEQDMVGRSVDKSEVFESSTGRL